MISSVLTLIDKPARPRLSVRVAQLLHPITAHRVVGTLVHGHRHWKADKHIEINDSKNMAYCLQCSVIIDIQRLKQMTTDT